jgi:hypothetical protein
MLLNGGGKGSYASDTVVIFGKCNLSPLRYGLVHRLNKHCIGKLFVLGKV